MDELREPIDFDVPIRLELGASGLLELQLRARLDLKTRSKHRRQRASVGQVSRLANQMNWLPQRLCPGRRLLGHDEPDKISALLSATADYLAGT